MKYREIYLCLMSALCLAAGISACTNDDEVENAGTTALESISVRLGEYTVSGRSVNLDDPTLTTLEERASAIVSIRLAVKVSDDSNAYEYEYSTTNQCWEPVDQGALATFPGYGEYDVDFMLQPDFPVAQNGTADNLMAVDTLIAKEKMKAQAHVKGIILAHKNTLLDVTFDEDDTDGFGILPDNAQLTFYQKDNEQGKGYRISTLRNRFLCIVQPNKDNVELKITCLSGNIDVSIPIPDDGFAPNTIYKIKVVKDGDKLIIADMDILPWSQGSSGEGISTPRMSVLFSLEGTDKEDVDDDVQAIISTTDGNTFNAHIEWKDANTINASFEVDNYNSYGGYVITTLKLKQSEIPIGRAVDGRPIDLKVSYNNINDSFEVENRELAPGFFGVGTIAELDKVDPSVTSTYIQTHNLDFRGHAVRSAPVISGNFKGEYDGGNNKIYNLYIEGDDDCALFDEVSGRLKNIHLASGSITSQSGNAAGICVTLNLGELNHCTNQATIKSDAGIAGGICAVSTGSTGISAISWCVNTGYVNTLTDNYAGGILGECNVSNPETITGCKNSGTIESEGCAGGITGKAAEVSLISCYNTGSILGSGMAGGLAGLVRSRTTIGTCYNTGIVECSSANLGSIAGKFEASPTAKGISYAKSNVPRFAGESVVNLNNFCNFSELDWPTVSADYWTAGTGEKSGYSSWKSLGSWNWIAPVFPKLWFE